MIPFELFEEIMYWLIYYWDNIYYSSHYIILNKNVSFSFDDLDIDIIAFFIINYWVLGMKLMNLRNRVFNPEILRINQRSYTFNVRLELINVFRIEVTKARLYWLNILLLFRTGQKLRLIRVVQISKGFIDTLYTFLIYRILTFLFIIVI